MIDRSFLAATAGCAILVAGCVSPAAAASRTTEAFLADVNPNVDFLDRSSRLALDNSSSARVKEFARAEAREQTLAANDLYAWGQTDNARQTVLADAKTGPDGLITGRSVAVDPTPGQAVVYPSVSQEDFDRMYGLTGAEFDDAYKTSQIEALNKLVVSYQEYITNGDEPTLKALATSELPKINRKLAELRRL